MRRIPWLRLQTCSAFASDLIFPDFLNTDIIWGYNNGTRIDFCTRVTIWSARSFCDLFMTCKSVTLPVAEKTRIASHAPLFSRIKTLHIYVMERMHAKSHHIKSTHSSCIWFPPFPIVVGRTTIIKQINITLVLLYVLLYVRVEIALVSWTRFWNDIVKDYPFLCEIDYVDLKKL